MADPKVVPIERARASVPADGEPKPELSLKILSGLIMYVRDHFGAPEVERIAEAAGLEAKSLDGRNDWASLEQIEIVLARARALFDDDGAFTKAFAYRMNDSLGPVRYVAWAASPAMVFDRMFSTVPAFSTISTAEMIDRGPTHLHVKYRSTKKESRLLCLSRQGMSSALPTLWGLPLASYAESSCIGWGDACCEYVIRWRVHRRRLMPIGGTLFGGVAAALALALGGEASLCFTLPMVGGLAGLAFEFARVQKIEQSFAHETQTALAEAVEHEAEARREVLELTQRQRDWTRLMEQYVTERTEAVTDVVQRLQELRATREVSIRGFSHDLKNPLQMIYTCIALLREESSRRDRELSLADLEESVNMMKALIDDLIRAASADVAMVRHVPQTISTATLADTLRRRLTALTHGREIKISAFSTREAPPSVEIDPLVLDRIIDNLLTNAAKYTHHGSIIAEVDGTPGFMTIKLGDTGRGIADDQLQKVFVAGASDERIRAKYSHGIGLSVVVHLLREIGGRLEVMSKEGQGTTFWVHIPEKAVQRANVVREKLADVVHIRRVAESS